MKAGGRLLEQPVRDRRRARSGQMPTVPCLSDPELAIGATGTYMEVVRRYHRHRRYGSRLLILRPGQRIIRGTKSSTIRLDAALSITLSLPSAVAVAKVCSCNCIVADLKSLQQVCALHLPSIAAVAKPSLSGNAALHTYLIYSSYVLLITLMLSMLLTVTHREQECAGNQNKCGNV